MNRMALFKLNRTEIIDRLANHIHNAAQRSMTHRNGNGTPLIDGFHAAHHTFGGFHGNAPRASSTEMLLHFEDDIHGRGNGESVADHAYRLINGRHVRLGELHGNSGTGNLNYVAYIFWHSKNRSWLLASS